MKRMNDHNASPIGRVGRLLRIGAGVLLAVSIAPFYLRGEWSFNLASAGVAVALVAIYMLMHFLVLNYLPQISAGLGAVLAFVPLIVVYGLGLGDGPLFGHGEGQLGALTFLATSLVLAGLRRDTGCEVMSIPNTLFRTRTHLACVFFSPLDWLEKKLQGG